MRKRLLNDKVVITTLRVIGVAIILALLIDAVWRMLECLIH